MYFKDASYGDSSGATDPQAPAAPILLPGLLAGVVGGWIGGWVGALIGAGLVFGIDQLSGRQTTTKTKLETAALEAGTAEIVIGGSTFAVVGASMVALPIAAAVVLAEALYARARGGP